jgi:hypothetical protein
MPLPTQGNARDLKPEIVRNEMVENVDQMQRIEAGGDERFASALSVFPVVNLNDPDEEWYTMDGARGPMSATSFSSESPVGTLDMPSKEGVDVQSYKKKYRPDKGAETGFSTTPYSLYRRAAAVLRMETFLTRERNAWLGDDHIDGLQGADGQTPHSGIPSDHLITPSASWSDDANAQPYDELTNAAFEVINNGRFVGDQALPYVYGSPAAIRDMKQTDDMEGRIQNVQIKSVGDEDVERLIDDEIAGLRKVMVYLPRTNANGEYIDETGTVVDSPDDAAHDNVLDPYDPSTDSVTRNVIVGRPGAGSAFIPWFSDRLLERANVAEEGEIAVDNQNGFFTQVWNGKDPLQPNFKAAQEIGFELLRGENWAMIQDV